MECWLTRQPNRGLPPFLEPQQGASPMPESTTPDPHDRDNGGHEPVDVDPFIPTGLCALCANDPA